MSKPPRYSRFKIFLASQQQRLQEVGQQNERLRESFHTLNREYSLLVITHEHVSAKYKVIVLKNSYIYLFECFKLYFSMHAHYLLALIEL
jgi:hypothetical protein